MKKNKIEKTVELQNIFTTSRGADPECFLRDTETGEIVSAIEILNHDKYDPIELGDGVGTYFDNCMLEFTIAPGFSRQEFVRNFRSAFLKISEFLKKEHGNRYEMAIQASNIFDEKFMDHPEARKIGCNPEFNADLIEIITPPDFEGNLRSAGGHIAIGRADFEGLDEKNLLLSFQSKIDLVRLMDYYVGVPFTLIDNDETSLARRKLYGSPSSHRPKPFGVEYRVLSNYWISSPLLVGLIFDLSEFAVQKLIKGEQVDVFQTDKKLVNACIQENNKELAAEIIDLIDFPKELKSRLDQLKNIKDWNFYEEWDLNAGTQRVKIKKSSETLVVR